MGLGGLAAGLAGAAAGENAASKKKRKKEGPAPRDFAIVSTTSVDFVSNGWSISMQFAFYQPATMFAGEGATNGIYGFELSPGVLRARIVRDIQQTVAQALSASNVPADRISVTLL
jgi:hypothetical protein